MPSKRKDATSSPASFSPSTSSASIKPSTAASSASNTSSPLKPSSKPSSKLTFGHSTPPKQPPPSSATTVKAPNTTTSSTSSTTATGGSSKASSAKAKAKSGADGAQDIVQGVWERYVRETPQRVKLVDAFMAFLVVLGGIQFVYCVVAGNYPFNAFLSGFSATVGQFVLTASLRIQTNPANKGEFAEGFSDERAFADYVFGSVLLHFFCVNFIN